MTPTADRAGPDLGTVQGWLADHRRTVGPPPLGTLLFRTYLVALFVFGPILLTMEGSEVTEPLLSAAATEALQGRLGGLLTALAAVCAGLRVRQWAWKGPVVVERPELTYVFTAPLSRAALLGPKVLAAWVRGATEGALVGVVTWLVLAGVLGVVSSFVTLAAGTVAFALVGVLGTCAGLLAQRSRKLAVGTLRAGTCLFALSAMAAVWSDVGWVGHVAAWSGPWGWAGTVTAATIEGTVPTGPSPALAGAGLLLVSAAALCVGWSRGRLLGMESLRTHAALAQSVAAGVFFMDVQAVAQVRREAVNALVGWPSLRLPLPRSARWLVVWAGATVLLRARWLHPRLLALGLAAIGAGLALAADPPIWGLLAIGACLGLGHVAAAGAVDPLRTEDLHRFISRHSVPPALTILRQHLVAPVAVLMLVGVVSTGTAAWVTSAWWVGLVVAGAAPGQVLVAAWAGLRDRPDVMQMARSELGATTFVARASAPLALSLLVAGLPLIIGVLVSGVPVPGAAVLGVASGQVLVAGAAWRALEGWLVRREGADRDGGEPVDAPRGSDDTPTPSSADAAGSESADDNASDDDPRAGDDRAPERP